MKAAIPRIVIAPAVKSPPEPSMATDDPLLSLIDLLRSTQRNVRALDLARALIAEGKAFAETPSGMRWAKLLSRSSIVENGWLLWNQANLDLSLKSTEDFADSPNAMFEDVLRRLMSGELTHYVSALNALLAEETVTASGSGRS